MSERSIISLLRTFKGAGLYIGGQCLLTPNSFNETFMKERLSLRPIFSLLPHGYDEKLLLIPDGDIQQFTNGKHVSKNGLSICINNTLPCMYILRRKEWKGAIGTLAHDLMEPSSFNETKLGQEISSVGLIQSTVMRLNFIATFQHEKAKAGTFTLEVF
jgi:hypothetical protein